MTKNIPILASIFIFIFSVVLALVSTTIPAKVTKLEFTKGRNSLAQVNGQQIKISFSRPMDQSSVEKAFSITPKVHGNVNWVSNMLFFTPTEPLTFDTEYTISFLPSSSDVFLGKNYSDSMTGEAKDIYGKPLSRFTQHFKTPSYAFAYIGNDDQLYLSDFSGNSQQITRDKKITEYAIVSSENRMVFIDKPSPTINSKVFVFDIGTGETKQLFDDVDADFSNTVLSLDGRRLYIMSMSKDDQGFSSEKNIYEYNFVTESKKPFQEIIKNHPSLTSFWLTPDGNTFLFNDTDGNYYLRPIADNKSTLIGRFNDFGGSTLKGDKLLFVTTDALNNWKPYLTLYDGKVQTKVEEKDATILPEISLDGEFLLYSYLPQNEEEGLKDQRVGVKMFCVKCNAVILSKIEPDQSYERAKMSPDNRLIAVEVYNRGGHFIDLFNLSIVKENPTIKFIDISTNKFIEKTFNGKNFTWLQ